jgi:uncharacterized membrane protein
MGVTPATRAAAGLVVVGFVLIVVGLALISVPLAVIVAGVGLLIFGLLGIQVEEQRK